MAGVYAWGPVENGWGVVGAPGGGLRMAGVLWGPMGQAPGGVTLLTGQSGQSDAQGLVSSSAAPILGCRPAQMPGTLHIKF